MLTDSRVHLCSSTATPVPGSQTVAAFISLISSHDDHNWHTSDDWINDRYVFYNTLMKLVLPPRTLSPDTSCSCYTDKKFEGRSTKPRWFQWSRVQFTELFEPIGYKCIRVQYHMDKVSLMKSGCIFKVMSNIDTEYRQWTGVWDWYWHIQDLRR